MRIFHLAPNLNFGGLQKVVRLLAVHQIRSGHAVTIGCWTNESNDHEADLELRRAGAQVVYLRRAADGGMSSGRILLLRTLKRYLGDKNTDILHVHNPFGYYLYGALAALTAGGTKVLNTIHLTAMFDHPAFGRRGRAQFWTAAILTDGIVSVCPEVDSFLRARFILPGNKLFVVENGIDLTPFLAVPARQPGKGVVFGFAGRMAPEKNHRVLIEAFALVYRKHKNARLRLLGGGALERKLKEQVYNLGLGDVVEFRGFSRDVPGFLGGLDIYVLPSDFEALPLSLLEAIASGLPVVATTVGGVPRIVRNTGSGWLCEPDNADALSAAMESAIVSPDRRSRGERARCLVTEQYSAERMAHDYERLYQKVFRKGLPGPAEPRELSQLGKW